MDASDIKQEAARSLQWSEEEIAAWSPKRRDFLRAVTALGGLATVGSLTGCGGGSGGNAFAQTGPTPLVDQLRAALLANAGFWEEVQRRFILNPQRLFMNIGTAGSMPRVVVDKFNTDNTAYATDSLNGYTNFLAQRQTMARGGAAGATIPAGNGFGVDADELVVSYNTSDGMSHALLGIQWQAGDVVITTNREHPGGDVPLAIARDRYGLIVRRITLPVGNSQTAAGVAAQFAAEIDAARAAGQRVRALMWSSPDFLTGTMLPIRRIVDVAIAKSNGFPPIITICDGAHLPGMMAYDYAALGVDFMAGAAHKWQCGPGSTGILIIRNKVRPQFNPLPLPAYFPVTTSGLGGTAPTVASVDGRDANAPKLLVGTTPWASRAGSTAPTAVFDIGSVIQSCGSKHVPLIAAVGEACRMWDEIGRKNIETYILTLARYAKEKIATDWGVGALYAPKDDPELLSALTSFDPFFGLPTSQNGTMADAAIASATLSGQVVTRMLNEDGIIVRNTTVPTPGGNRYPLRLSTHLWHDPADVDRALSSARRLARAVMGLPPA
jgi:selenocysteine lyase/cysteine desulfurase